MDRAGAERVPTGDEILTGACGFRTNWAGRLKGPLTMGRVVVSLDNICLYSYVPFLESTLRVTRARLDAAT